jgi:hypothetical protein
MGLHRAKEKGGTIGVMFFVARHSCEENRQSLHPWGSPYLHHCGGCSCLQRISTRWWLGCTAPRCSGTGEKPHHNPQQHTASLEQTKELKVGHRHSPGTRTWLTLVFNPLGPHLPLSEFWAPSQGTTNHFLIKGSICYISVFYLLLSHELFRTNSETLSQ